MLKKIYIFYTTEDKGGYYFVALAEDGTCLSTWRSQSKESAKTDMTSDERRERYDTHYAEGVGVCLERGPINPDTMPSHVAGHQGSAAFIEGQLHRQFL